MGNCVEAFAKQKVRRIETTSEQMIALVDEQLLTHKAQIEQLNANIRSAQSQYDNQASVIKSRTHKQPTDPEKQQLTTCKQRIMLCTQQRQLWNQKLLRLEQTKMRLQTMKANTKVMIQQQKIAKGYKKLQDLGIDTTKAESIQDKATDAAEDMEDFNKAFETDAASDFTVDDMNAIEQEIENEFNAPSGLVVGSIPIASRVSVPTQEYDSDMDHQTIDSKLTEIEITTD
jgi:hypothetical protein